MKHLQLKETRKTEKRRKKERRRKRSEDSRRRKENQISEKEEERTGSAARQVNRIPFSFYILFVVHCSLVKVAGQFLGSVVEGHQRSSYLRRVQPGQDAELPSVETDPAELTQVLTVMSWTKLRQTTISW